MGAYVYQFLSYEPDDIPRPLLLIGLSNTKAHQRWSNVLLRLGLVDTGADDCMCSYSLCRLMSNKFSRGKKVPVAGIGGQHSGREHACNLWVFPPPKQSVAVPQQFVGETVQKLSRSEIKRYPGVLGPYEINVTFMPRPTANGKTQPDDPMPWPLLGQKGFLDHFAYAQDRKKGLFGITPL